LGAAYKTIEHLKSAIGYYKKVREHFPNYISAQINLLELYYESKQIENANELFRELNEKSPNNSRLGELKAKYQVDQR
jgi:tetratricopeptide (TPR) repeat protein